MCHEGIINKTIGCTIIVAHTMVHVRAIYIPYEYITLPNSLFVNRNSTKDNCSYLICSNNPKARIS